MPTPSFLQRMVLLWLAFAGALGACAQEPDPAKLFDRYDADKDGKITQEEMGRPALFKRLDHNGDGVLLRAEADKGMTPLPAEAHAVDGFKAPEEPPQIAHLDIRYDEIEGVDPKFLSLDLYVPKAPGEKRPVLIFIHGGGWWRGDKGNGGAKRHHFVGQGYVFANINYRLSPDEPSGPEERFPMHALDCAKALAWIHDHIAEYGGDPEQLHLMGHSAGGHLAGILGTNERFLKTEGKDLSILKSNVLLDPAGIDISGGMAKYNGPPPEMLVRGFGKDKAIWRDASPIHHISADKDHPPTLIFYSGSRLNLNEDGVAMAEKLTAAGAPSQAVDTVALSHTEVNTHIGLVDEPMTALVMRLHAGEDATTFPSKLD